MFVKLLFKNLAHENVMIGLVFALGQVLLPGGSNLFSSFFFLEGAPMNFVKRHAMICLLVLFTAGVVLAADPTGKWSWTFKAGKKDMQKDVTASADLKLADGKLTGRSPRPAKSPRRSKSKTPRSMAIMSASKPWPK